ncbi:zinc-ribbon-domain-containing protein [Gorgonomyces haynaldii]|nr:zinc-ribbon-domain-containing protein [Gorgonomyces haynaldii]
MAPSYHSGSTLGCKHYQRGCKLQAHCCGKWYPCRNLTTTMMCMHCNTTQPAGQDCINQACRKKMSKYYCSECKLWDDDPRKNIYHCHDCGICRIGKGLGQDYFHCEKCNPCGHCIHYKCHQEYIQTSYQCPTCFKSLANMTEYFRRIDAMLAMHSMPPEYKNTLSHVYCNDCEKKSHAKYHFLYHKCSHCLGYNTKVLGTLEGPVESI